jgi:hypothetical protein
MQAFQGRICVFQKEGIEEVFVNDAGEISWIKSVEGKQVDRNPRGIHWEDVFAGALAPIVGFLIPWASIKLLIWVVGGFITKPV